MMEGVQQMKLGKASSLSRMSKAGNPVLDVVKWWFGMRAVTI
jgi:hypothetical protein